MRYGSVCSGIEAATMGWHHMGWEPAFFSEIEEFPRQALAHHYPDVPCHGDFTTIKDEDYGSIDLLVGGTPCQSFSIAGLRGGMADERGNLALEYLKLAQRKRPKWLVWENVPGVLSSNGGRDFGAFLGGLVECGYGWAYRICDAQYFGVAQRRRRVFVVGYLGDWRRAAAVLFERESLSGNPAPSREKGEKVAPAVNACFDKQRIGQYGNGEVSSTLAARDYKDATDLVAFASNANADAMGALGYDVSPSMLAGGDPPAVAFQPRYARNGRGKPDVIAAPLTAEAGKTGKGDSSQCVFREGMAVRRLTPTECERLQGFPDGFTQIPWRNKELENCPDGPRYKALGNSMAVPVMRWIGERIQAVEGISNG